MIVRRLRKEELIDAAKIRAIAFHGKMDEEEMIKHFEKTPDDQMHQHWGCFNEDGTMMAGIINNDYRVNFDGHVVKMGGIGGVSTLPEYRYGGAVKATLLGILRTARAEGEVFSSLYPFSHEFYRKAGYEMFAPIVEFRFQPDLVGGYKHTGWVKRVKKEDGIEEMRRIYRAFAGRYNLMLERSDGQYRIGDPFRTEEFTMLLGDERGARAFLWYRTDREDGKVVLNVRDIAFEDAEGFRMCLGYIGRMSADYGMVKLALPEDVPLLQMVPRSYEVTVGHRQQPMARTTNVIRALELMKKPEGTDFVIKVTDDFLPENSGVYRVTGDGASVTEAQADIEVSEQAFTLMALGALSLDEAGYRTDVKVSGKRDALSRVFVRKPLFIADYF